MKDYYATLDVPPGATIEQIRARYKQLVRIYHPDRFQAVGDRQYAEEKLKSVNEAYKALLQSLGDGAGDLAAASLSPRPIVVPPHLSFTGITPTERQIETFRVDNLGGPAEHMTFRLGGEHDWFSVAKGRRLQADQALPLEFEVAADGRQMDPERAYQGWVDVLIDGMSVRVSVTGQLVQPRSAFTIAPRLVVTLIAICSALVLVYLGSLLYAQQPPLPDISFSEPVDASQQNGGAAAGQPALVIQLSPTSTPSDVTATSELAAGPTDVASRDEEDPTTEPVLPTAIADSTIEMEDVGASRETSKDFGAAVSAVAVTTPTPTTSAAGRAPVRGAVLRAAAPIAAIQAGISGSDPRASVQENDADTSQATVTATATATLEPTATVVTVEADGPAPGLSVPEFPQAERSEDVESPEQDAPVIAPDFHIQIPDSYNVVARTTSSVNAAAAALLPLGSIAPLVGRTADSYWLQISLPDGQRAWVYRETVIAPATSIADLPIVIPPPLPAQPSGQQ